MQTLPADRQEKPASALGSARSARRSLAAAFASFAQTAGSLEATYVRLQAEVRRLRNELENKNRSLAQSLEENTRMRSYLTKILESLPCGVLVFHNQTSLRMLNPAARRLLDAGGGRSCCPEATIPGLLGSLLAALPKEEFDREQEWVVAGSEETRTLGVTRAFLREPGSEEESILILRDITDAKQLEREREVSRRTQALAEVATLLAHEIRNPLGSLELFAGLLANALSGDSEVRPWINHVQAGLRTLAATVNNVLHFHSPPEAQLRSVDLIQLVGDTVEFLRPLALQTEMRIEWQTPMAEARILADPSRLRQAFLNLAVNAFRAMKPGGTLYVNASPGTSDRRDTVALVFRDEGTGISAENLGRIFEPGFSTGSGSPGLGLAVTRKVIEQHGGTIRVESEGGQGTKFALELPTEQPPQGARPASGEQWGSVTAGCQFAVRKGAKE